MLSKTAKRHDFFLISLLFVFLLYLVFNEKILIVLSLFYGISLFYFFKFSLLKSIFFTLLFTLPLARGIRGWLMTVVAPGYEIWDRGYSFYFGITLPMIFLISLILLLLIKKSFKVDNTRNVVGWLLIVFFTLASVSTFFSADMKLSLLGLINLGEYVFLFFISSYFFRDKKTRKEFIYLWIAWLAFLGWIGIKQLITKMPLGIFLESTGIINPLGYYTTDGDRIFRAAGLTGHPTFFGSQLMLLIPIGMGLFLSFKEKIKLMRVNNFVILSVVLGILGLLATFSRSAWLAFILIVILFWRYRNNKIRIKLNTFVLVGIGLFGLILTVFGPLVFLRLKTAKDLLEIGDIGNIEGRLSLINQAWLMIISKPLFGVGINRFTAVMAKNNLSDLARGFMFPVHNTFLLFFSEMGILAGLTFIAFFIGILVKTWKKVKSSYVDFGVWLGVLSFFINAQFHTLFNQDASFAMVMIMLGYLVVL
jgi:O-antigen ligase